MKLIVGLGNPGKEYTQTRHNIGWITVEALAAHMNASAFQPQNTFHATIAQAQQDKEKILFVLPQTFMNSSGKSVAALVQFYHVPLENLLIVQDEMDFPIGRFAFAQGGGAAGHNGIASIYESLGDQAHKTIARMRIGIGRPIPPLPSHTHVLQPFTSGEEHLLTTTRPSIIEAIVDWANNGLARAMNQWNQTPL